MSLYSTCPLMSFELLDIKKFMWQHVDCLFDRNEVEATCFLTTAFLIEASVCEMQWQRKNNRINQTIISVVLIIISKIQYHVFQISFTIQDIDRGK